MSEVVLAEGIYVRRRNSKSGVGMTARERVVESLWFPLRALNEHIELYPVTDDLKRVLRIKEKISVEVFEKEFSIKDNSREAYLELKKTISL